MYLEAELGVQVGGTEAALFDYARGGPQWGADALIIGPPQVMTLLAFYAHYPLHGNLACLESVDTMFCQSHSSASAGHCALLTLVCLLALHCTACIVPRHQYSDTCM